MRECDVRSPEAALAYMIDCTLATVTDLAMKKSRGKSEFKRQIGIAQKGINWARDMHVDLSTTRDDKILNGFDGSVEAWAKTYMPEEKL